MARIKLPDNTEREGLEEGFYRDAYNHRIFYLSKKSDISRKIDEWYFQFYWTERPVLITPKTMPFYAEKVDLSSDPKVDEQDKRFIESKLASLTEKTP